MLKPTVKRGLMLDFIPDEIICAEQVDKRRVHKLYPKHSLINVGGIAIPPYYDEPIIGGDIIYLSTRELRLEDNWAVVFGQELAEKHNKKFKIVIILSQVIHSKRQEKFLLDGIEHFRQNCIKNGIDFEVLEELPQKIGALIVDFNPLESPHPNPPPQGWRENCLESSILKNDNKNNFMHLEAHSPPEGEGWGGGCAHYPIFEVDSHNIIPARHISDKQEYSAATLRRKIYANITDFLTEYPLSNDGGIAIPPYDSNIIRHAELAAKSIEIISKHDFMPLPGVSASYQHTPMNLLKHFINNKLDNYAELKNNPQLDATSNLSPYLTFGFVSSQRVAIEVIKSDSARENKEAFLEELIVRKELSDNFCLYAKSFQTFESVPQWAQDTLNEHRNDIRNYIYSKDEFEYAKTHDKLWNKIQEGLINNGKIHGYLRMIWAKKILEWSKSPEEALEIAIYLNDKYALDGNNPNGYVGILWSLGALHDRPFTNRFVFGKIRYMKGNFT